MQNSSYKYDITRDVI